MKTKSDHTVSFKIAMAAENIMKKRIKILTIKSLFFSVVSFFLEGIITSSATVEADVKTRLERNITPHRLESKYTKNDIETHENF